MEPEGSLPHSHVSATCPYTEPTRSSPYPTSHLLKIHLNIILPSMPGSSLSGFPTKTPYTPLLSCIHVTCPAHLILLDSITRTIFGEQYRSLSSSLYSFLHYSISSLLGPNILLNTLFSNAQHTFLSPCKRPRFTPIRKTGKIIIQYILIFIFFDSKLEDIRFCMSGGITPFIMNLGARLNCGDVYTPAALLLPEDILTLSLDYAWISQVICSAEGF